MFVSDMYTFNHVQSNNSDYLYSEFKIDYDLKKKKQLYINLGVYQTMVPIWCVTAGNNKKKADTATERYI